MTKFTLRPYQSKCLEDCIKYIEDKKNTKKAIVIQPTGAGKSISLAAIANYVKEPIINVSPNKELLEQNLEKYLSYGNKASVFSASLCIKELSHVTFCTIGSIKSEVKRVKDLGVKLLLVDECNLMSKNGSQLANFINETGIQKVIGFSAYPIELSSWQGVSYLKMINRSRSNIFQEIIHCTQVKEIVEQGFWAKIKYEIKESDKSKLRLNSNQSDFTDKSLQDFYDGNSLNEKIANEVFRLQAEGRKSIICFVPSIVAANQLSNLIPGAYAVSSETPKKERTAIVQGFKNLQIPVVCNVNIFSYGFDAPRIDAIVKGRPTNSFSLYAQQIGRGVRPHPDKEDCKIVDFSGNVQKFGQLENIEYKHEDKRWGLFSNGIQLTTGDVFKEDKKKDVFDGKIYFGRYKNLPISEVPNSYLSWLLKEYKARNLRDKQMLRVVEDILSKK